MPIIKSAKKALRVAGRRRVFNRRRLETMREALKNFKKLVAAGETAKVAALLPTVYQAIDKAKKRGVIKANAAARQKSQAARAIVAVTKKASSQ
ncbi:MAG: 30S ribosomal protein S20 [Patescibacteria group bacterium]